MGSPIFLLILCHASVPSMSWYSHDSLDSWHYEAHCKVIGPLCLSPNSCNNIFSYDNTQLTWAWIVIRLSNLIVQQLVSSSSSMRLNFNQKCVLS